MRLEPQSLSEHRTDRLVGEEAVVVARISRIEAVGDLAQRDRHAVALLECLDRHLQHLGGEGLAPFIDEVRLLPDEGVGHLRAERGTIDQAQKRQCHLVEARLDLGCDDARIGCDRKPVHQPEMQQLVAKLQRFPLQTVRKMDRDARSQWPLARLLGQEPALKRPVLERFPHADDLRSIDMEGMRIELLGAGHDRAQDW